MFRAFNECSYEDVKVVLIGQDCYPGTYKIGKEEFPQATGLCFDNSNLQRTISGSLRNILKEAEDDLGEIVGWEDSGYGDGESESRLGYLPQQGVLMLNTALTVEPHKAGSHAALWKPFTDEVFKVLNGKDNIVWIMLGNHAKSYKSIITNPTHKFVEAVHPSPLSANRGFFGSKIFSRTNQALIELGHQPINW